MEKIYKLTPSLHANIWGGNKLREYGKDSAEDRIGESWELSFVPGAEARLDDGRTVSEAFSKEAWGRRGAKFDFFPVLTKFIDAREKLSVQVHPDDSYALANEGQYGKSEMWYVVDAEEGAGLYMGTSRDVSAEKFAAAVKDGTVEDILSFKEVKAGDVFYIPAGTIHAIGAGVLIFEIQQNSTLTYRLYDYMRRDKSGNLRELHVDKAMKVLSPTVYKPIDFSAEDAAVIGKCEYFTTKKYTVGEEAITLTAGCESFLCITSVNGSGTIEYSDGGARKRINISLGESYFIPAADEETVFTVTGDLTIITVEV